MMIHPFIFLLDTVTLILFLLTLVKQLSLQSHYKNANGLRYHRLAYIGITFSLSLHLIFRILVQSFDYSGGYHGYFALEIEPLWSLILLTILKLFMLVVAIFSYSWFKGSKFLFLKIFDKFI